MVILQNKLTNFRGLLSFLFRLDEHASLINDAVYKVIEEDQVSVFLKTRHEKSMGGRV